VVLEAVSIPLREEKMLRFFLPNGIAITQFLVVVFLARRRRDLGKRGASNPALPVCRSLRFPVRQTPEKEEKKDNYLVAEISYL
jgi:hypothetical protein